ncbi:MAG: hypothetical protein QOJ76_115 [Acidobacteriota bacterium]|nr:hypothetical protein [Acidobacteriota bacterium]
MSKRYGDRGFGSYGDESEDRNDERMDERYTDRGYGDYSARDYNARDYGRGAEYTPTRGDAAERGGVSDRDYGSERDRNTREYGSRDYGSREYGSREYGMRPGREGILGGYAGATPRRQEGEEHGREYGAREYGRNYGREQERGHVRGPEDERDRVRAFDTDYGRTTSRFYGRSGYDYGRDDYEDRPDRVDARGEYGRRAYGARPDEREARGRGWWDRAADEVLSWLGDEDAGRRRRTDDPREAGRRGEGKFRGRGPKNYRRSDERIREEIGDRLTENEWLDASDVEVTVSDGEVILSGTVDSRYAKRLAEHIAESTSGVANVQNNLRVQSYQTGAPSLTGDAGLGGAGLGSAAVGGAADIAGATDADPTTGTNDPADPTTSGRASRAAGRS